MSGIKNTLELSELLLRLLEGTISDEQFSYLQLQLSSNPFARQYYFQYMQVSSALNRLGQITNVDTLSKIVSDDNGYLSILEELAEYEKNGEPVKVEKAGPAEKILTQEEQQARIRAFLREQKAVEEQERTLAELERRKVRRQELQRRKRSQQMRTVVSKMRKVLKIGAAAAVVMVVAFYLYALLTPVPPAFVATLTDGADVKWADSRQPAEPGSPLEPGTMKLVEGYARITFNEGASVILQAPCSIDLQDTHKVFLESGKLIAYVPLKARGFKVNTPTASIIDLGTEFGVYVAEDGTSDVHVFKGRVSLLAGSFDNMVGRLFDTVEQTVEAGQARCVKAGTSKIKDIQFGKTAFMRDMPSPYELAVRKSHPSGYWRFGSDNSNKCVNNIDSTRYSARYVGSVNFDSQGPDLGDGKPNYALGLDGQDNTYMIVENITSSRLQRRGFSLVLWIRADEVREQSIITNEAAPGQTDWFSRYLFMENNGRLVFAVFSDSDEVYESEEVETSLIRSRQTAQTGRWYHLAVTISHNYAALFVDGRLEGEGFNLMERAADTGVPWYLCTRANIAPTEEDDAPPINGAIDELAVYNRALSAREIESLYLASQQ